MITWRVEIGGQLDRQNRKFWKYRTYPFVHIRNECYQLSCYGFALYPCYCGNTNDTLPHVIRHHLKHTVVIYGTYVACRMCRRNQYSGYWMISDILKCFFDMLVSYLSRWRCSNWLISPRKRAGCLSLCLSFYLSACLSNYSQCKISSSWLTMVQWLF
jgi:hypothetical protein